MRAAAGLRIASLLAALACLAPFARAGTPRGCGTPEPTGAERDQVRGALTRWGEEGRPSPAVGTIRVAFHVITSDGQGDVSDARIAAQIEQLNRAYTPLGWRFELAGVERTEQPGWFHLQPGGATDRRARQALGVDPAHTLNLYTCAPASPVLGWATSPFSAAEDSPLHGVVVHYRTLPGGAFAPDSTGATAVHQVGHYLGLTHGGGTPDVSALLALYRPSLVAGVTAPASDELPTMDDEPTRALAFRGGIPNPFRSDTAIRFTLPLSGHVTLRVYDVAGKLVRTLVDAQLPPGDHSALMRAEGLASGTYFTVLRVGAVRVSRSLTLIR